MKENLKLGVTIIVTAILAPLFLIGLLAGHLIRKTWHWCVS